jgi:dTDP-4-dehydrorhamnose reductase
MKKVLITGSNGLLGQKLNNQLIGYPEYQVFATSKGENRTLVKKALRIYSFRYYG